MTRRTADLWDEGPATPTTRQKLESLFDRVTADVAAGALLREMAVVLRDPKGRGGWSARAQGCPEHAYGDTPEDAMRAALALAARPVQIGTPTTTRRRIT